MSSFLKQVPVDYLSVTSKLFEEVSAIGETCENDVIKNGACSSVLSLWMWNLAVLEKEDIISRVHVVIRQCACGSLPANSETPLFKLMKSLLRVVLGDVSCKISHKLRNEPHRFNKQWSEIGMCRAVHTPKVFGRTHAAQSTRMRKIFSNVPSPILRALQQIDFSAPSRNFSSTRRTASPVLFSCAAHILMRVTDVQCELNAFVQLTS